MRDFSHIAGPPHPPTGVSHFYVPPGSVSGSVINVACLYSLKFTASGTRLQTTQAQILDQFYNLPDTSQQQS